MPKMHPSILSTTETFIEKERKVGNKHSKVEYKTSHDYVTICPEHGNLKTTCTLSEKDAQDVHYPEERTKK